MLKWTVSTSEKIPYILLAAIWIGLGATALTYFYIADRYSELELALFGWIGVFLTGVLIPTARRRVREQSQQAIDIAAQTAIRNGKPYSLFLRAFLLDGKVLVEDPNKKVFGVAGRIDFPIEEYIREQIENKHPLVCIGERRTTGVAAIVTTDDAWTAVFHDLAERAERIVILPGGTSGLLRELSWASAKYLEKMILIMPPSSVSGGLSHPDALSIWDEVGRRLNWLDLPQYRTSGGAIAFEHMPDQTKAVRGIAHNLSELQSLVT